MKKLLIAPIITIALLLSGVFSGCRKGYQPHNENTLIFWKAGEKDDGFLKRDDELNDLCDSVHKYLTLSLGSLGTPEWKELNRKYDSFYISYQEAYKIKTFE